MANIRLYVDHPLSEGQSVALSRDQANYLFNVMRLQVDDTLRVINGKDGEFEATVAKAGKRNGILVATRQTQPLRPPPDLWLLFAPVKKARTDFIVEKATELGVAHLCPVLTDYTNSDRLRTDKLRAHVIEAAEQCGATYVPDVAEPVRLGKLIETWPQERKLIFCDETLAGQAQPLAGEKPGKWAILIGPEGGFSPAERDLLHSLDFVRGISLGPRILRADTAAVAALTLWQSALGDW